MLALGHNKMAILIQTTERGDCNLVLCMLYA